ncbi:hypothetical protein ACLOJK_039767 [Asimina triloba]
MGRTPCCDKVGLKRGSWTPEEDQILKAYIEERGPGNWRNLPKRAGLLRCGKSCRFRWTNYLRPDVKRGNYSKDEEDTIIRLHGLFGNRWSKIAASLPGRTDNEIKNVWNTQLRKRLERRNQPTQEVKRPSAVPAAKCKHSIAKGDLERVASESNVTTIIPPAAAARSDNYNNFSYMEECPRHSYGNLSPTSTNSSSFGSNLTESNNIDGCVMAVLENMSPEFLVRDGNFGTQPDLLPTFDYDMELELQSSLFPEYCDGLGSFCSQLLSEAKENDEEYAPSWLMF